jgi:hypothetical protein
MRGQTQNQTDTAMPSVEIKAAQERPPVDEIAASATALGIGWRIHPP